MNDLKGTTVVERNREGREKRVALRIENECEVKGNYRKCVVEEIRGGVGVEAQVT